MTYKKKVGRFAIDTIDDAVNYLGPEKVRRNVVIAIMVLRGYTCKQVGEFFKLTGASIGVITKRQCYITLGKQWPRQSDRRPIMELKELRKSKNRLIAGLNITLEILDLITGRDSVE